ncbi:MAG: hypothetical protein F6J90_01485 [Moorea sp. SIOASIH]|uniref:hypothetical protein n=1 Tax=Moorena sp. SIOASIH TaxID=2607817 RepID=UPI0013B638E8|nr:hypothetical protein [Moorena sp. SIOASIH]NEO35045.1 hypothetical protein [Moorena sp. SIOASIH]
MFYNSKNSQKKNYTGSHSNESNEVNIIFYPFFLPYSLLPTPYSLLPRNPLLVSTSTN